MTIGATIKQLRQEQDITQEQLADALGITSRAVSQWETDRTATAISQVLTFSATAAAPTAKNDDKIKHIIDFHKKTTAQTLLSCTVAFYLSPLPLRDLLRYSVGVIFS